MGYHHSAFATRDLAATHRFYTEAMGFPLAKVVIAATDAGGWAKHVFYEVAADTFIAFWELHDDSIDAPWPSAISTGIGLPIWVNHLAFRAADRADLDARCRRLLDHSNFVSEIDHGWCRSIYVVDPNGILVEFCTSTRAMTDADREEAHRLLAATAPEVGPQPQVVIHKPTKLAASAG